jgi:hypothetical protein
MTNCPNCGDDNYIVIGSAFDDDAALIGWACQCLTCLHDFTVLHGDIEELGLEPPQPWPLVALVEDSGTPDLGGNCPYCYSQQWVSYNGVDAHCYACGHEFIIAKLDDDDDTFHIGGFK